MNANYGPCVTWEQLQIGVRIYYVGDMANADSYGVIFAQQPIDPKWGYKQVHIVMDDDRVLRGIHLGGFQPAPGRRFWLAVDWEADKQRRIEQMQADFARVSALRIGKAAVAADDETIVDTASAPIAKAVEPAPAPAPHQLGIGDILYSTWGYDQTNVDFYQVIRLTKACVIIRAIASRDVSGDGWTGKRTAVKDAFIGEEMRRKIGDSHRGEVYIRIDSSSSARLWDGKPVSYTAYA